MVEPAHGESITATLVEAAGRDPQFAADLRCWIEMVAQITYINDSVSNAIGDDARVMGNVVQARDVTGPITFR
jgi:hypothetical protein